ncbi:hypothetical protein [Mycolicibacterium sp. 120270]|uniref:hypothetical protein n=1 Tax=Mycolicibacterium sp. 120270 TaxID=3090600 RepID=UPI00299ED2A9|nr:hypothetical protein [Mycolicibacterium sp. 120270]MDX1883794.1 hypothetical protein [Mycolicibacterium sp. 120270]
MVAAVVAVLAITGLSSKPASEHSVGVADAVPPSVQAESGPVAPPAGDPPRAARVKMPPTPFAFDDKGFIDSSARCQGGEPAHAIARTTGSLVVICGEQAGRYEYLGVRLSDEALLRTGAESDSARSFLARRAGVVYEVSPRELKVTSGTTVIKQEPMIEYRLMAR